MSSPFYSDETNSQIPHTSINSITSHDDDDNNSNDQSDESISTSPIRKKPLGRVKIEMNYIDNKIRRYTTFSKRKTGIMKKAYELATLTGTEVMLLVASETGHVYTYATEKLQPMITSETGKALIQTCLAKEEPSVESIDKNQRKKRTHLSVDDDTSTKLHPTKHVKLNPSEEIKQANSATLSTIAFPLSCLINPDSLQQLTPGSPSFTIDLNSLKNDGMNIVLTPSSNSSQPSPLSNAPLVLTLGNFPFQQS